MLHTRQATSHGASAGAGPLAATPLEPMAMATTTSTAAPRISLIRFQKGARMAGPVEKTPSLAAGSGVSFQCGQKWMTTSTEPQMAPRNCADQYMGNCE